MSELHHKEFENYLAGEHELSRLYSQREKPAPSAELDTKIMAEALAAQKKTAVNQIVKRRWWMAGLDSPLALAAIVMLCASLVLLYSNQQEITVDSDIPQSVISKDESYPRDQNEKRLDSIIQERNAASHIIKKEIKEAERTTVTREHVISPAVSDDRQKQTEDIELEVSSEALPASGMVFKRDNSEQLEDKSQEEMVADIKHLISEGQNEQARLALRQFITTYPDAQLTDWFSDKELAVIKN